MKRETFTNETTEVQKIIRGYYEQLYVNKLKNLAEKNKFLETCNLPILNYKEI